MPVEVGHILNPKPVMEKVSEVEVVALIIEIAIFFNTLDKTFYFF